MRRGQGFFTTVLMIVPMTAVPVMAIFGIPQFVPAARPETYESAATHRRPFIESRVGQSDAPLLREISIPAASRFDLFQAPETQPMPDRSFRQGIPGLVHDEHPVHAESTGGSVPSSPTVDLQNGWTRSPQASPTPRQSVVTTGTVKSVAMPAADVTPAAGVVRTGLRTVESAVPAMSGPAPIRRVDEPSANAAEMRYQRAGSTSDRPPAASYEVRTLTWRQAVDELNHLGIRTFRLTPGAQPGAFQFSCLVSSVDDPRVSRWFDAEADEPLVAVARVLETVENWNRLQ